MSVQVRHRRDTAANIASFTPAQGELIVDTTNNRAIIGDGATAGGWATGLETRTAVADAAYTALATDRLVAYTSLTAARIVSLPPAASYPRGARLTVVDEAGAASASLAITIARAGTDTINGAASAEINSPYGSITLESNGSNSWVILSQTVLATLATVAQGGNGSTIKVGLIEQIVSGLSGATVTAGTQIPAGALVLGCGSRVTTTITGATGYSIGYTGSTTAFGSGLGLTVGTTNQGLVGPNPLYSPTNILLTALGSNFTAGAVRLSLAYILISAPTL